MGFIRIFRVLFANSYMRPFEQSFFFSVCTRDQAVGPTGGATGVHATLDLIICHLGDSDGRLAHPYHFIIVSFTGAQSVYQYT